MKKWIIFILLLLAGYCQANIKFLGISDIHYGEFNKKGPGEDTGKELLNSSMQEYKLLNAEVDFIVTLGDFPTHDQTYSKKAQYLEVIFNQLYSNDPKQKPIFYITGNNDSLAGNYLGFTTYKNVSPLSYAKNWNGACAYCKGLIINDTYMLTKGFYSSYVIPNNKDIILIALNSMPLAKKPLLTFPYFYKDRDANEELIWFEEQLKQNHAKQLLIAMHIPPGFNFIGEPFWQKNYLTKFINLLEKYHANFGEINLLNGHNHMSDLRKIQLSFGNIYDFSIPSISRNHYNNPAISIFDLNANYELENNTIYYTSDDKNWQSYQLIDNVFPQCTQLILKDCFNKLGKDGVCKGLEKDGFYATKSLIVNPKMCNYTYDVN